MRDINYVEFRKRLLSGGVAPKYVKRLITELRHHYDDTVREAQETGLSSKEASIKGLGNLGDQGAIIKEALARPELKSWSFRWPWAIFGLGPIIAFVALLALFGLTVVGSVKGMEQITDSRLVGYGMQTLIEISSGFITYIGPLILAVITLFVSSGREARMLWPTVGAILVIIFGCGISIDVRWPGALVTELGSLRINWGYGLFSPPWDAGGSVVKTARVFSTLFLVFSTFWLYKKYAHSKNMT